MGALGAVIGMAFGEVGQTLYLYFIASKTLRKIVFRGYLIKITNQNMLQKNY